MSKSKVKARRLKFLGEGIAISKLKTMKIPRSYDTDAGTQSREILIEP